MFLLVALFSFPAAFVGTALTVFAEPQTVRWYAIFVSPGWFAFELFSPYQHHISARNGGSWIDFWGNFTHYFGLIFAFVFWADRRWAGSAPPESMPESFTGRVGQLGPLFFRCGKVQ
jgi:hypothetical protein